MTVSLDDLRVVALDASRLQGCTCEPDINIIQDPFTFIHHAQVAHDAWCPLG